MTALEIVRQLAAMSTPGDSYKNNPSLREMHESLEDYTDELSSDRMEDDARALWRLIDEARECLRDEASAEAAAYKALGI